MKIDLHRNFIKQYKKAQSKVQKRFDDRIKIFLVDPFDTELNNHSLHGKLSKCRSINVTGDWRAIYEITEDGVRFLILDRHSNLYD